MPEIDNSYSNISSKDFNSVTISHGIGRSATYDFSEAYNEANVALKDFKILNSAHYSLDQGLTYSSSTFRKAVKDIIRRHNINKSLVEMMDFEIIQNKGLSISSLNSIKGWFDILHSLLLELDAKEASIEFVISTALFLVINLKNQHDVHIKVYFDSDLYEAFLAIYDESDELIIQGAGTFNDVKEDIFNSIENELSVGTFASGRL